MPVLLFFVSFAVFAAPKPGKWKITIHQDGKVQKAEYCINQEGLLKKSKIKPHLSCQEGTVTDTPAYFQVEWKCENMKYVSEIHYNSDTEIVSKITTQKDNSTIIVTKTMTFLTEDCGFLKPQPLGP